MTPEEHYEKAEGLLEASLADHDDDTADEMLAAAFAHALLALAGATMGK